MSIDPASGGMLITIGRVFEEVTATRTAVQTLTGNVSRALEQGADHENRLRTLEHEAATKKALEDLERDHGLRLSSLERKVYGWAGAATLASLGGSALIAYLTAKH